MKGLNYVLTVKDYFNIRYMIYWMNLIFFLDIGDLNIKERRIVPLKCYVDGYIKPYCQSYMILIREFSWKQFVSLWKMKVSGHKHREFTVIRRKSWKSGPHHFKSPERPPHSMLYTISRYQREAFFLMMYIKNTLVHRFKAKINWLVSICCSNCWVLYSLCWLLHN